MVQQRPPNNDPTGGAIDLAGAGGDFAHVPADWIPDALYWADEQGRIVYANSAGCDALGYTLTELVSLHLWDIDPTLSVDNWPAIRSVHLKNGFRSVHRRKTGEVFPVQVRGHVVVIAGRAYGISIARDLTEISRAEKAARDAEHRTRTILDSIPDLAWMKDEKGCFLEVNHAMIEMFHIPHQEWPGKTDFDIVPGPLARRYRDDDRRVLHEARQICVEEPIIGNDGVEHWIETIKMPVTDSDGEITGTVGIAREITARKQKEDEHLRMEDALESAVVERTRKLEDEIAARRAAEAALREKQILLETIIEGARAIIFVKGADGRYLIANRQFQAIGNWRPEDLIGHTAFDIFPHDIATRLQEDDAKVMASQTPQQFEETIVGVDGVLTVISLKAPLFDSDGNPAGICCVATDITQRREAEKLLLQAKEAAEQASRAKSDFLCMMSHELRTPLNAIIGFADALALEYFGPLNAKQKDYAGSISHSGLHLLQIINDILEFARADADRMQLSDTVIDIGHLFDSCLQLVSAADRRINQALPPALPTLWADELRIRQIMVNLLGNAVKFSAPGSAITLRAMCRDDGGMTLSVEDHGIGMRAEDIPRVREMFTQIDTSIVRRHEGTGIGLPLAVKLAEAHGGQLKIESAPGIGTTVHIELPPERTRHPAAGDQPTARDGVS